MTQSGRDKGSLGKARSADSMVAKGATYNHPKFDQRRDVLKNLQRSDMKKEKGKRLKVKRQRKAPKERHVYRNKSAPLPTLINVQGRTLIFYI
jgi:hypothetical protein